MGLGFGLERIGYVCVRFPWRAVLLILVASVIAGYGISRVNVDDSLTELFRADTPQFKRYEELSNRFPSSEFDVLVIV